MSKADIPSHNYDNLPGKVNEPGGNQEPVLDPAVPFFLTKIEDRSSHAYADYPHRHDYYEILYISEGEGLHFIDFEAYPIKPPMFYFVAKNQTHYWRINSPIKGYAMLFPEEFLGVLGADSMREHDVNFFQLVERTPYLSVCDDSKSMLKQIIDDLATEFNREKSRSLSLLRAYLHVLLTQLRRSYLDHQTNEHAETPPHYVNQFQQLLSQHFITEHSVQYYADKIGISTTHLNDSVKNATGNTPGQLIRQKLVVEAKRLLVHSSATVSEIGYHLNFEDSSYFARFFKRETNMSPSAFRHQFPKHHK